MNAELKHATQVVESAEFRFIVNQAADLRALKQLINEQDVFQALQKGISADEKFARAVVARMIDLSSLETDNRYEHPYDTALATYLLALEATDSQHTLIAAQSLVEVPGLWWAMKLARQIVATHEQMQV